MIDDSQRLFRRADLAPGHPQAFERLRAGDLVDEVEADEQLRLARWQVANGVKFPHLL
jgi:hypothetical protein